MTVSSIVLGVGRNALATNVPTALLAAAARLGVATRVIDLASVAVDVEPGSVTDANGPVVVTHLAPVLLYWADAAGRAYEQLELLGAPAINPVVATELADDKARTAIRLHAAGVPQMRTIVADASEVGAHRACREIGYPCVVKRTHGAQGRWVRLVQSDEDLRAVLDEFTDEGPSAVVVQEVATDFVGRSIRVLVLRNEVVGATLRTGAPGAFVSNITAGGSQEPITLRTEERTMAIRAAAALGLGFAGVDLCRQGGGSYVLEVNACPDFTSMLPFVPIDLAEAVVRASIA